uniref:Uncharacterized protein n=1 Tax=Ciona intestinalis TaxID=7719 RepID=H2XT69_CIOIN
MLDGGTNTDRRMCPWARHLTDIAPTQRSLMGCPNYSHTQEKTNNYPQICIYVVTRCPDEDKPSVEVRPVVTL